MTGWVPEDLSDILINTPKDYALQGREKRSEELDIR